MLFVIWCNKYNNLKSIQLDEHANGLADNSYNLWKAHRPRWEQIDELVRNPCDLWMICWPRSDPPLQYIASESVTVRLLLRLPFWYRTPLGIGAVVKIVLCHVVGFRAVG